MSGRPLGASGPTEDSLYPLTTVPYPPTVHTYDVRVLVLTAIVISYESTTAWNGHEAALQPG